MFYVTNATIVTTLLPCLWSGIKNTTAYSGLHRTSRLKITWLRQGELL